MVLRERHGFQFRQLVFLLLPVFVVSCSEPIEPNAADYEVGQASNLSAWLSGEAEKALGPNGLFIPIDPSISGQELISREEAEVLAGAFLNQFGKYIINQLERQHGAPIDLKLLKPSGRIFLAETPYEPMPPATKNPVKKNWGPYFLITYEQNGVPAVRFAVSSLATDLAVVQGRVEYIGSEGVRGNEFRWAGIHRTEPYGAIIPPEAAARLVGENTGAKVSAPPEFFRRSSSFHPYIGYWRIQLDRPVLAQPMAGGPPREVTEVYVDMKGRLGIGRSGARPEEEIAFRVGNSREETVTRATWRSDLPRSVDPASLSNSGGGQ